MKHYRRYLYHFSLLGFFFARTLPLHAQGAAMRELSPIHSGLLMLHFAEGMIAYHGVGQLNDADVVYRHPLNTEQSGQPAHFAVSSPDDPGYVIARQPTAVGRKSKGDDFSARWPDYPVVLNHYLYVALPAPMQEGKTYTVHWNSAALQTLQDQVTFVFQAGKMRSEAVHVNQIGYMAEAGLPKYGYVYHWAGDMGGIDFSAYQEAAFYLVSEESGATAFSGTLAFRGSGAQQENTRANEPQNYTRCDVWECDFSAFDTPGAYRLVVEGIGTSYPFRIGHDVYREVFYHTARALYHQRAGLAKDNGSTEWAFPRDHHPDDGFRANLSTIRDLSHGFEGNLAAWTSNTTGETVEKWGWYHDAGDWDPYPRHVYVPNYLLTVYELFPDRFSDGELGIPESGNGIPDIIDEAAWVIHYLKRTTALSPSGGVLARSNYAPPPPRGIPSWADPQPWYATTEDPSSTFFFAAGAAQLAYNLDIAADFTGNPAAADSSASLMQSARAAFDWALNNSLSSDSTLLQYRINRLIAAVWMYKYTGEAYYQDKLREWSPFTTASSWDFRWMEPVFGFATCPDHPNLDINLRQLYRDMTMDHAESWMRHSAQNRNLRMAWDWNGPSFVGLQTTPQTLPAIVAYALTGDETWREIVLTSADFNLGCNPLNMVWVTGIGQRRPDKGILHLDSWYYEFEGKNTGEVIPGIVPYAHHVPGMDFTGSANGPHNNDWAMERLYPPVVNWPVHETWQNNRQSPRTGEFTINQNLAKAAAVYGFLSAPGGAAYQPTPRPVVSFLSDHTGSSYAAGQQVELAVQAFAEAGMSRVGFFAEGLCIAVVYPDSTGGAVFQVNWTAFNGQSNQVRIEAVAYDRRGNTATARTSIGVNSPTNVLEYFTPGMKLFPNPAGAGDSIGIELPEGCPLTEVQIIAPDGRIVCEQKASMPEGKGAVSSCGIGRGWYLLKAKCGPKHYSAKIILE